jgi:chromosome segregation protein
VEATAEAESAARARWRQLQHDSDTARERFAAAEREANQNAARRSALTEASARLNVSRQEAQAAKEESVRAFEGLPSAAESESRLAAVRADVTAQRSHLAEVRGQAQTLAREAEIAAKRVEAIAGEEQSWGETRGRATSQISTLAARASEALTERDQLADAPQAFADKRAALMTEIQSAEETRRVAGDQLVTAERTLAEMDRVVRAAHEALSAAREQSARAEERCQGASRRVTDIEREIRDMLEVEPQGVAALAELVEGAELPDVAAIEADLEKLRRDRERLGAVNLRAEEELREVETQHTALTTERDDLVEAIRRLRLGIQNLNREARERLLASFEVVNGHFKRLFTQLFGGGEAELQLIESEDPLDAGLEILAKPPGKKPQTLSLLSGGEQALTAMALIFAVFLTNPAPICVLDEVDAPLDDHNVERFCDLLDEMTRSTDTRFVIITHNPITMARMNRLFGVTMAERGISQLVSVDLEAAVKIKDQAGAA